MCEVALEFIVRLICCLHSQYTRVHSSSYYVYLLTCVLHYDFFWFFVRNILGVCMLFGWFFFMFSNLCQVDPHNKTCVVLANLRWSDNQIGLNLPWSSYAYRKCIFLDFLIKYIGPCNRVHYWAQYKVDEVHSVSFYIINNGFWLQIGGTINLFQWMSNTWWSITANMLKPLMIESTS